MRKIIQITGPDATSFLQKITSNDVKQEGLIYSLLLTPQGKLLDDFFLLRDGVESWLLDCYAERAEFLFTILKKYSLGAKISLNLHNTKQVFLSLEKRGYQDPRNEKLGYRFYAEEAVPLTEPPVDIYYDLCMPRLYLDLEPCEFFPFDLGFDYGISYSKGCYIGQEVITRTKFRGEVRKKVIQIKLLEPLLQKENLYVNEKKIGKILGFYPHQKALALVKKDLLEDIDYLINEQGKIIAKVP